ncbi:MAG: thioredoxin family protein [Actinomycetota bacterium]
MIEVLHIAGCPTWEETRGLLERVTGEPVATRLISTAEEAEAVGFCGSPTVRVDGADPWADQTTRVGLACRLYRLPDGRVGGGPTEAMVRTALNR